MERIILGRTGLDINRFGFGGIPIQTVTEERAVETVRHAVECGVDFIDTSRAYTNSERRIGMALRQTDKRVVLATKTPGRQPDAVKADVEKSLTNLGVSYIDLYQCHFVRNFDDYSDVVKKDGTLDTLVDAKDQGLIGHIGITSHSLDVLDRAIEDSLFDTIMVCFSFLEPKAKEDIIPKALKKDIGVIAMKSFSGGVIEDPAVALKYVLLQPGIAIIPGVERTDLFDQNWTIYTQGDRSLRSYDHETIRTIRHRYDKLFCRRCDYCQPCSENIPISVVLHLRSIIRRMGEGAMEKPWLSGTVAAARACSECGECLERCPYELPIPELIRDNLNWLDKTSP